MNALVNIKRSGSARQNECYLHGNVQNTGGSCHLTLLYSMPGHKGVSGPGGLIGEMEPRKYLIHSGVSNLLVLDGSRSQVNNSNHAGGK